MFAFTRIAIYLNVKLYTKAHNDFWSQIMPFWYGMVGFVVFSNEALVYESLQFGIIFLFKLCLNMSPVNWNLGISIECCVRISIYWYARLFPNLFPANFLKQCFVIVDEIFPPTVLHLNAKIKILMQSKYSNKKICFGKFIIDALLIWKFTAISNSNRQTIKTYEIRLATWITFISTNIKTKWDAIAYFFWV